MKLREIMRPGPITIDADVSLGIAHWKMTRSRIRHLPVTTDADHKLIGIVSERDLFEARALAADEHVDWWSIPVRRAMRTPAHTAGPDDSVTEAAGRMAASKLGALPIVELGKVIGIVTTVDILEAELRTAMAPAPRTLATAADAMTPWPVTVRPEARLSDAVRVMRDRHVRHLPVVDRASTVVGILSERDVRTAIGDPSRFLIHISESPVQFHVSDVMSKPALVVPFDRPLSEVSRIFADQRIGAVPVVDKFGALIGIVSYVDVLRMLAA